MRSASISTWTPLPNCPTSRSPYLDNTDVLSEWIPAAEIESRPVYPLALRELLDGDSGTVRHIVNRENLA